MTQLVLTKGLPASGKTTFARSWVADGGTTPRARLNRDEFRFMLTGKWWPLTSQEEERVTWAQCAALEALLEGGVSVVVDDTNLRDEDRRRLERIAERWGVSVRVVDLFMDVSLELLIARDYDRGREGERSVGEDVIRRMHARYIAPAEKVEEAELIDLGVELAGRVEFRRDGKHVASFVVPPFDSAYLTHPADKGVDLAGSKGDS